MKKGRIVALQSERIAFVKKHWVEIENIINSTPAAKEIHADLFVRLTAKPALGYSKATHWLNIWVGISKTFKTLQKEHEKKNHQQATKKD